MNLSIRTGQKAKQAPQALPKKETAAAPELADASPVDVKVESEPQEPSTKKKLAKKLRKGFLSAASTGLGALNAVASIPPGIQIALDTKAGNPSEVKRLNSARISTITSAAGGSAIGAALLGPVGLVVGGVVGYIAGTLGNHLEARSGIGGQSEDKISASVEKSLAESDSVWGSAKAVLTGAVEGAKHGFRDRKVTSKIQMAGMLDGVKDAVEDNLQAKSEAIPELGPQSKHGALARATMLGAGVLFGVAGVAINAPGGLVIGILESLKETQSHIPSQMTKNVMLWATNLGKFLPAAAIGAIIGGPVGIAASTLVGVATASVTSMIDGRLGVNRKIASPVEKAVKEAHGEQEVKENLRAYHRAGKGAVVGLAAGVREGWKAGFQGGVEVVRDALAATPESIEKDG